MHDWSTLLAHATEVASKQTWALPPDDLFQRILAQVRSSWHAALGRVASSAEIASRSFRAHFSQINRSKRDILQDTRGSRPSRGALLEAALTTSEVIRPGLAVPIVPPAHLRHLQGAAAVGKGEGREVTPQRPPSAT